MIRCLSIFMLLVSNSINVHFLSHPRKFFRPSRWPTGQPCRPGETGRLLPPAAGAVRRGCRIHTPCRENRRHTPPESKGQAVRREAYPARLPWRTPQSGKLSVFPPAVQPVHRWLPFRPGSCAQSGIHADKMTRTCSIPRFCSQLWTIIGPSTVRYAQNSV